MVHRVRWAQGPGVGFTVAAGELEEEGDGAGCEGRGGCAVLGSCQGLCAHIDVY